jgi:hypothetical protein
MPDFKLSFQVHPIVAFGSQPVLLFGAALAHQNDRSLNGGQAGQYEIEKNEGIGIKVPASGQNGVDHHPNSERYAKTYQECPTAAKVRKIVSKTVTKRPFVSVSLLDIFRNGVLIGEALRDLPVKHAQFAMLCQKQFFYIERSIPVDFSFANHGGFRKVGIIPMNSFNQGWPEVPYQYHRPWWQWFSGDGADVP